MSAAVSTHVLDTARGVPAAGISIRLDAIEGGVHRTVGAGATNADGRTDAPLAVELAPGTYELTFFVAPYFRGTGVAGFYDEIPIRFKIVEGVGKYHVPLLLSPWGYGTYRGS